MKYDIIGDVHGCHDELLRLMKKLGYTTKSKPRKRQLVFVGDLVNNGPDSVAVLKLVMKLVDRGIAIMVLGNHDLELKRVLQGKQPCTGKFCKVVHDINNVAPDFADKVIAFLKAQPTSLVLNGNVLVVHAAYRDGVSVKKAKQLAVFGECAGDAERWVREYDGQFDAIVRGHWLRQWWQAERAALAGTAGRAGCSQQRLCRAQLEAHSSSHPGGGRLNNKLCFLFSLNERGDLID